ncbi:hypothetical protein O6H91_13G071700 [Diphasiastrum complanatum]|uniref:Uncharacterized protein n=2 Tax=Diphasiastrum complanatum TaxID=34168 RepID=A0ACC2BW39_DIPCM|nr:hypothetical protein O6H91_13G071700 [Diphasiastrum complanatum]KAJ7533932.1 hypothetical protein O6H91_13G071700 [Diphasiastrum complanatum]
MENQHTKEMLADSLAILCKMEATKMLWKVEANANAGAEKIQDGFSRGRLNFNNPQRCENGGLLPKGHQRFPFYPNVASRGSFQAGYRFLQPMPETMKASACGPFQNNSNVNNILDVGGSERSIGLNLFPLRSKNGVQELESPKWLPEGWSMEVHRREGGRKDKYYTEHASGQRFRSKSQVLRYLDGRASAKEWVAAEASPLQHNFACKDASDLGDSAGRPYGTVEPNSECGFTNTPMTSSSKFFRRTDKLAAIGNMEDGCFTAGLQRSYIDLEEGPEGKQSAVCKKAPYSIMYKHHQKRDLKGEETLRYLEHVGVKFPPTFSNNLLHGWCISPINASLWKEEHQRDPHSGLSDSLNTTLRCRKAGDPNLGSTVRTNKTTPKLYNKELGDCESRKRKRVRQWQQKQQLSCLGKSLCLQYITFLRNCQNARV